MKPLLIAPFLLTVACATTRPTPVAATEPPAAASTLSPRAAQEVVNSGRRAFQACIAEAAKTGTYTGIVGRRFALRLWIDPNGSVTRAALDDATIDRTDLGECLRAAARIMVFPRFQGEVFHLEVPFVLRDG